MKTKNIIIIIWVLICAFSINSIHATSYSWLGNTSTDWGTAANWSPSGVPTTNDTVSITSYGNHQPVLDQTRTIKKFTISSVTLDLNAYDLTISNTSTFTSGTITNGRIYPTGVQAVYSGTTFSASCEVSSVAGKIFLSGGTFNAHCYFEDTITNSSHAGAGGCTFNGSVIIKKNSGANFGISSSSGNTFNDTVTFLNVRGTNTFTVTDQGTTYFNGHVIVGANTGGDILFSGASTLASGKTIGIDGTVGFPSGDLRINNLTQSGGTAQSFALTGAATVNFYNDIWNGSATFTAPHVLIKNTTFNSTASLTQTSTTTGSNSDGGNTFNAAATITCSGGSQFRLGMTYDDTFNSDLTVSGNVQIGAFNTTTIKGNLIAGGSNTHFNSSGVTGTAKFAGSNSQHISSGGTGVIGFNKIKIDKTAGSVTLDTTITVDDTLTFVSKNIITTSSHFLSMLATSSVTGAGSSSFVEGPVKKTGNTAFVFPTGKNSIYRPIEMSAPSTSTNAYTAEYFDAGQSLGNTMDNTIKYIRDCGYWSLARNSGSSNVTVYLNWDSSPCGLLDSATVKVANWNTTTWKDLGNAGVTGNSSTGKVANSTTVITWGYFALAYNKCFLTAAAGSDQAFCAGDSVTIGGTPVASMGMTAYTYSWSPSTALSSTSVANPKANPSSNTNYIITVTDLSGCSMQDTITVTYRARPTASAGSDKSLCDGSTVSIGGSPTASGGTSPYTYSWSPSTALSSSTAANPNATPHSSTSYIVTVTDANGCTKKDTVVVNNNTITYTWTGATSSDWTTSSNWSPAGVPDSCDNVIIVSATNDPVYNSAGTYLNSLTVNSGTLDMNGSSVTISRNAIFNSGTLLNASFFIFSADTVAFNGTHMGDGFITATANTVLLNGSTFDSYAYVELIQTGSANTYSTGGNVFDGIVSITNTGSGNVYLSTTAADVFSNYASFISSGSGLVYPCYTKNSIFNGPLTTSGRVTFGSNGGRAIISGTGDPVTGEHYLYTDTFALFKKLQINKSSGDLLLSGQLVIGDSLILTNKNIVSDTVNLVIMNAGSVVSGVSDNSFVSGAIKKIGNTAFAFPVGKGNYYRAIEMSAPSSATDAFTAEYFDEEQTLGDSVETTIKFLSDCDYWMLKKSNGSSNVTVKLNWNLVSCHLSDSASSKVANWDGIKWVDLGNGGITGNYATGRLANSTTVNTYSYFTIAYVVVAIPINLSASRDIPDDIFGVNGANTIDDVQGWQNTDLRARLPGLSPVNLRYPGGNVGNYWDWRDGFFLRYLPAGLEFESNYGQRTLDWHYDIGIFTERPIDDLESLKLNVDNIGGGPVYSFNMLSSDKDYQLAELFHASEINLPVKYVELGNEFYLDQQNYKAKYHSVVDYSLDANDWASTLKTHFPDLKVAALGAWADDNDPGRRKMWLQNLLPYLSSDIDAVTLHIYIGGGSNLFNGQCSLSNNTDFDYSSPNPLCLLQKMLNRPFAMMDQTKYDELSLVGQYQKEAWITEYNLFDGGNFEMHGTWAQGLFASAMTLNLLESEIVTKLNCHTMMGTAVWSAIFGDDCGFNFNSQFATLCSGTSGCGGVDPDCSSDAKEFTAVGNALSLVGRAIKNFVNPSTLIPEEGTLLSITTGNDIDPTYYNPFDWMTEHHSQLYGWKFEKETSTDLIIMNLGNRPGGTTGPNYQIDLTSIVNGLPNGNATVDVEYMVGNPFYHVPGDATPISGLPALNYSLYTSLGTLELYTVYDASIASITPANFDIAPYSIIHIRFNYRDGGGNHLVSLHLTDDHICNGTDSKTTAIPSGFPEGASLTFSGSGGITVDASTGEINADGSSAGSYTVTVTDGSSTASATLTVNGPLDVPDVTASSTTFCSTGSGPTLTINNPGDYTYWTWTPTEGVSACVFCNPITVTPDSTQYYIVYATDGTCYVSSDHQDVDVDPVVTIRGSVTDTICSGSTITLVAEVNNPAGASNDYHFVWSTGATDDGYSSSIITSSLTSNTTYTVSVTYNSCTVSAQHTVNVLNCCSNTGSCDIVINPNKNFNELSAGNLAYEITNSSCAGISISGSGTATDPFIVDGNNNLVIYFNGNINGNRDFILQNCTINFSQDAAINLNTNRMIRFENCSLQACTSFMWDKILAVEGNSIEFIDCVISDGVTPADLSHGATYEVTGNEFNNNYASLYIHDYEKEINGENNPITDNTFDSDGAMLVPYSGQNSPFGVYVKEIVNVQVGEDGASPNNFTNLVKGIYCDQSSLKAYNNTFSDITDYGTGPGYAIHFESDFDCNDRLLEAGGNDITLPGNEFTDCPNGIFTDGETNVNLYKNQFLHAAWEDGIDMHIIDNPRKNIIVSSNHVGNEGTFDPGNFNIGLSLFDIGQWVKDPPLAGYVQVNDNEFYKADASGVISNFTGTAITIQNSFLRYSNVYVYDNRITDARIGIHANNAVRIWVGTPYNDISSDPTLENTVKCSTMVASANNYGIWLQQCDGAMINDNKIFNYDNSTAANFYHGIDVDDPVNCFFRGNEITGAGSGSFAAMSFTNGSEFDETSLYCNTFEDFDDGIQVQGGTLPQQGEPPTGWLNEWTNISLSVRVDGSIIGNAIPWYHTGNSTSSTSPSDIPTIYVSPFPNQANSVDCNNPSLRTIDRDEWYGPVVGDSATYSDYAEEKSYKDKKHVYQTLKNDTAMLTTGNGTDADFRIFYENMQASNIELLSVMDEKMGILSIDSLISLNESITDTNTIEYNKKTVNLIYLNSLVDNAGLSSGDSLDLEDIALQPSITGGSAVYSARAILFLEVHDEPPSPRLTNAYSFLQSENIERYNIYPNPGSDVIYLFGGDNSENRHIEIFDMVGKKVYDSAYENKIEIKHLNEGIYSMTIMKNNIMVYKTKFIKIKN